MIIFILNKTHVRIHEFKIFEIFNDLYNLIIIWMLIVEIYF